MSILDLIAGKRAPVAHRKPTSGDRLAFIAADGLAAERPDLADHYRAEGAKAALAELDQKLVDDARTAATSEASRAALTAALTADRKRVGEIVALLLKQYRPDLIAELIADPEATMDTAARRVLEVNAKSRAAGLAALEADEALNPKLDNFDTEEVGAADTAAQIKAANDYAHRAAMATRQQQPERTA